MNDSLSLVVGLVVVLFTKGLLLFLAAFALTRIRFLGPEVRHAAWAVTLAGLLVLPLAWLVLPPLGPALPVDGSAGTALQAVTSAVMSPHLRIAAPLGNEAGAPAVPTSLPLAPALFGAWILGATAFLVRSLIGRVRIRAIVAGAADASTAASRLGLRPAGRLLATPRCMVPFAFGIIRPVVVLPAAWPDWTSDTAKGVLLHEDAHLRRRDPLLSACAELVCALLWFVPMAWAARRFLLLEAERSCDALVIRSGLARADYAEGLVAIARTSRGRLLLDGETGAAGHRFLETRLRALMADETHGSSYRILAPRLFLIGFAALLPLLAMTCSRGPSAEEQLATERAKMNEVATAFQSVFDNFQMNLMESIEKGKALSEDILENVPTRVPLQLEGRWVVKRGFGETEAGGSLPPFFHPGIDMAAKNGTFVRAAAAGKVTRLESAGGYDPFPDEPGRYGSSFEIEIQHKYGFSTVYANVRAADVIRVGSDVQSGAIIGVVDNQIDPAHAFLHYEVKLGNQILDPVQFLDAR